MVSTTVILGVLNELVDNHIIKVTHKRENIFLCILSLFFHSVMYYSLWLDPNWKTWVYDNAEMILVLLSRRFFFTRFYLMLFSVMLLNVTVLPLLVVKMKYLSHYKSYINHNSRIYKPYEIPIFLVWNF